ncbi:uncharacterized protein FOMMEDRAFT_28524 [Fomitiporia mediterranea MF3/22]|uniref:uncharacterized protein n=1 Tax=Fomitiporia mediterranea (strain MF3/22) TaxID=694068 RepID=UPI0004408138|nr:uncharacterized protein FOMMEDRAFT_28524 [Fomitiporia mediterranea MF3/22]EJD02879.1 hypothetical protein FOMMEDRAFT_28524 [Fomitiporia mediterranea MF3/22]
MHSLTSKESGLATSHRKASFTRRSAKHNRFSDRWPVLNKIIRTSKVAVESKEQPQPELDDPDALSDDEDGEGDAVIIHTNVLHNLEKDVRYQQRVIHPASPKYPSPLSGARPMKRLLLSRHNYPHRGYSHSALYHCRELWRRRKCEWDDYEYALWQSGVSLEDVYDGIVDMTGNASQSLTPHVTAGPWHRKSNLSCKKEQETTAQSPAPLNPAIFPRLGDLSSARDPFLISVDTWFADFPLWTLSKMIWIYDVNHRANFSAGKCEPMQLSSSFVKDFDEGDSFADTLSTSYTSDTTLVSMTPVTPRSPKDTATTPSQPRNLCSETRLTSSASLDLTSSTHCPRLWERCWFSRWEVLYNQIGLAADIAASSEDPLHCADSSKEAARIILTTAGILYDADRNKAKENDTNDQRPTAERRRVVPMEEEEDDYGEVICSSKSAYRLGAQVDPLSMFATATTEYLDPFLASIPSSGDADSVASHFSRDYASEIADMCNHTVISRSRRYQFSHECTSVIGLRRLCLRAFAGNVKSEELAEPEPGEFDIIFSIPHGSILYELLRLEALQLQCRPESENSHDGNSSRKYQHEDCEDYQVHNERNDLTPPSSDFRVGYRFTQQSSTSVFAVHKGTPDGSG